MYDRVMEKEMADNKIFGSQGYFMSNSVTNIFIIQDYKIRKIIWVYVVYV